MNNLVENKAILIGNMALLKEYRALSTGHRALLMVHIQNVHIHRYACGTACMNK